MQSERYLDAARALHDYLVRSHWDGRVLVGPDPVGKINWRVTRFARSYFPFLFGDKGLIYLQGQAYWIRSNLKLLSLLQDERYLEYASASADYIVAAQPEDGAWLHPPIRGRRGFISTVEGVWASLGLTAAYAATGDERYLQAAIRWYDYQVQHIGFEPVNGGLAANYYAHTHHSVPNVTTMLIWLTVELERLTGDGRFTDYTEPMLTFIESSQLPNGELPYVFERRPHFMCYQYNSFQFLDLAYTYEQWPHERLLTVLRKLALFLSTGLLPNGSSRYDCFNKTPEVTYWGGALASALRMATQLGLGDYLAQSDRAYQHLLSRQRSDGGFDFSRRNYSLLRDQNSYPRYLAMILHQLLCRAEGCVESARSPVLAGIEGELG
jgi:hypothetical protein